MLNGHALDTLGLLITVCARSAVKPDDICQKIGV